MSTITASSQKKESKEKKMKIEIFTESLCPFCKKFISNSVAPAVDKGLLDMVNLTIVPYGNEHIKKIKKGSDEAWYSTKKDKHSCQHGYYECIGNTVENCFVHHLRKDKVKQIKALACLEDEAFKPATKKHLIRRLLVKKSDVQQSKKSGQNDKRMLKHKKNKVHKTYYKIAAKKCSKKFDYPFEKIWKCVKGAQGKKLIEKARKNTPHMSYVPWIKLNGDHMVHLKEDELYDNIYKFACDHYKGKKHKNCSTAHYNGPGK